MAAPVRLAPEKLDDIARPTLLSREPDHRDGRQGGNPASFGFQRSSCISTPCLLLSCLPLCRLFRFANHQCVILHLYRVASSEPIHIVAPTCMTASRILGGLREDKRDYGLQEVEFERAFAGFFFLLLFARQRGELSSWRVRIKQSLSSSFPSVACAVLVSHHGGRWCG